MFRDMFSSPSLLRKIIIPAETEGYGRSPAELRALDMMGGENWYEF
jgi:hypothetical protein